MKHDLLLLFCLALMAFVIGAGLVAGSKTVNHFWPNAPYVIKFSQERGLHENY